jgi:hypothetical protein
MLLILGAWLAVGAGCGGGGDGGDGGDSTSTSALTKPEHDSGCSDDQPRRIEPSEGWGAYVTPCYTRDGTTAKLKNVSDTWLTVTPTSQEPAYFQDTLGLTGDRVSGSFDLPAAQSQIITSDAPVSFNLALDWPSTVQANLQEAVLSRIRSRFQSPGRTLLLRAQNCAQSAGDLARNQQYFQDAVRSVLGGQACLSLVRDVLQEEGALQTERNLARSTDEFVEATRVVAGGSWKDELIRQVTKLHAP